MDALIALANPAAPPAPSALDPAVMATIVGASVTGAILALIVARALRLHRTKAAKRSVGRPLPIDPSRSVLVEPKPRQFQQAA